MFTSCLAFGSQSRTTANNAGEWVGLYAGEWFFRCSGHRLLLVWISLLPSLSVFFSRVSFPLQEEREKRRLEQLERKKELQRLLEEEDSKLKGKLPKPLVPGKVTRAQIDETLRKDQKENGDAGELLQSPVMPASPAAPSLFLVMIGSA